MVVFRRLINKEAAKHVDVRSHTDPKAVRNGSVKAEYCPSTEATGTALTKPSRPQQLKTVKELIPLMVSVIETT